MVSYSALKPTTKQLRTVLILVVVEDGLVHAVKGSNIKVNIVLILVVVEDGLVQEQQNVSADNVVEVSILVVVEDGLVLNKFDLVNMRFTS